MKFGSAYLASTMAAAMVFAAPASAQQTDWSNRVTMSSQGGHIKGNPLAKHSVAEYMSYTCNHCANFEKESHTALTSNFIKNGNVNFEVRNFVLNPIDLTAAMLARCGGRTKFFGNHRAFLSQQTIWLAKFQSTPKAQMDTMNDGTVPQRLKKIAKAAGFYGLMQKRGYSAKQVNACLSDKSQQDKVLDMTEYATKTLKLTGTPSFTLNGKAIDKVHNWSGLQSKLAALPQ